MNASLRRRIGGACSAITIWRPNAFVRNVTILGGGTAIGQLIGIIVLPIISRLYSPEDFGALAVFASILAIAAVAVSLRYELAIPIAEDDAAAADLLAFSLIVAACISAATGLLLLLFYEEVTLLTRTPLLTPYLWLVPVGMLASGCYQTFSHWAIRKRTFSRIAATKVRQTLASAGIQIVMGAGGIAPLGLLLGHIGAQAAGTTRLARLAYRDEGTRLQNVTLSGIVGVAVRYVKFPMYMTAASFLNTAGLHLPALALAMLYSPHVVGAFFLAQKILGLPVQVIGAAVGQAFLAEAAQFARNDPVRLLEISLQTMAILLVIGTVPAAVLFLVGPWFCEFAFGAEWRESGVMLRPLAATFLLKFGLDSIINLGVVERQELALLWSAARIALIGVAACAAAILDMQAITAIAAMSGAMACGYLLKAVLWVTAIRQAIQKTASSACSIDAAEAS